MTHTNHSQPLSDTQRPDRGVRGVETSHDHPPVHSHGCEWPLPRMAPPPSRARGTAPSTIDETRYLP
jgi:hypothetical protein